MKRFRFLCFTFALLLGLAAFVIPARSQPTHIGAMITYQPSYGDSGNGETIGGIVDGSVALKHGFNLIGVAQFSADPKIYRNQNGGALRTKFLMRKYFAGRYFAQGGLYAGGIYFSDTPGTQDGYVKYIAAPVAGAGVEMGNGKSFSAVADYIFQFKRKLYARDNELTKASKIVDGWNTGQRGGVKFVVDVAEKSKFVYLFEAAYGRYTYNRNPAVYGKLGGIDHNSGVLEISMGVGFKPGFR